MRSWPSTSKVEVLCERGRLHWVFLLGLAISMSFPLATWAQGTYVPMHIEICQIGPLANPVWCVEIEDGDANDTAPARGVIKPPAAWTITGIPVTIPVLIADFTLTQSIAAESASVTLTQGVSPTATFTNLSPAPSTFFRVTFWSESFPLIGPPVSGGASYAGTADNLPSLGPYAVTRHWVDGKVVHSTGAVATLAVATAPAVIGPPPKAWTVAGTPRVPLTSGVVFVGAEYYFDVAPSDTIFLRESIDVWVKIPEGSPAVSSWGMGVSILLLLTGITIKFGKRRAVSKAA